jgi:hypothetical protein
MDNELESPAQHEHTPDVSEIFRRELNATHPHTFVPWVGTLVGHSDGEPAKITPHGILKEKEVTNKVQFDAPPAHISEGIEFEGHMGFLLHF